ncbi:MAG: hypothetical protein H6599_02725 [Flavobacteriales bacterium]|nr:hypothetical protein [Flavobacteriales bacterium]
MFEILNIYLKCWIHNISGKKSPYSFSFKTLYREHTFRVPTELKSDFTLGIKYWRKSWIALRKKGEGELLRDQLVFDGDSKQKEQRLSYLAKIVEDSLDYISVDSLEGISFTKAVLFSVFFTPLFFSLVLISSVSKNRASYSLSILSITQNYLLLNAVRKHNIRKIYYFFPYENDANFNALILMDNGVEVIKVPGPNTLHRFHQFVVSNKLALCTGFQFEQVDLLKENWFVDEVYKWPLYGFQEYLGYVSQNKTKKKYEIGLISSGIWRRRQLGLQSLDKEYESEELLIDWVRSYMVQNHISKLFVYLHPIERKTTEIYQEAMNYYSSIYPGVEVDFSEFDVKSFQDFDKVNLALSSHSTTNLQRLFCGYKVFYTPMLFQTPLFPNTSIDRICLKEEGRFVKEVTSALKMTDQEFFDFYGLNEYHYGSVLSHK